MSSPEPTGDGRPDLFRALLQLFSDPQRLQWDLAAELARYTASDGEPVANVDPIDRIRVTELCRVAELQVASASGLEIAQGGLIVTPETVTAPDWAARTLDDWKPLLSVIAEAHSKPIMSSDEAELAGSGLPPSLAQVFGQAAQAIGPAMLGMQLGSSIGVLARRAFGQYDFPIPRPHSDRILLVPDNIGAFAHDWSLPVDDVCLWVCIREIAHHAVMGVPHVRSKLMESLEDYARHFSPDSSVLEERLADLDMTAITSAEELQKAFGDPSEILATMVTPEQHRTAEAISALVAPLCGWVDHVMDQVGQSLIASYVPLSEALRRRRVERGEGEKYIDVLFGLSLDQAQFDRGTAFVDGVVERAGEDGLARLWARPEHLPTPADVDAPGLWLERISYLD